MSEINDGGNCKVFHINSGKTTHEEIKGLLNKVYRLLDEDDVSELVVIVTRKSSYWDIWHTTLKSNMWWAGVCHYAATFFGNKSDE